MTKSNADKDIKTENNFHSSRQSSLKNSHGFTIIELLMAVAIIATLATAALLAINPAQRIAEAHDSERLKAFGVIRNALQAYYTKNNRFPEPSPDASRGDWDTSDVQPFIQDLVNQGFLKNVPVDPINNAKYHFAYYRYNAGQESCDRDKGAFIVFGIRNFESTTMRASDHQDGGAGAWSCSFRDWGDEFAHVFGMHEAREQ